MMAQPRSFLRNASGATAAEFALVLPLLILFLFGIIDAGRIMWTWNQAEKATQMGVRMAVATDVIPSGLVGYSFAVSGGIPQGDPIPESAFGGATCQSTSGSVACACKTGATCPALGTANTASFTRIVTRMNQMFAEVAANNVVIDYSYSGLGFAGDPNGSDVAPLVTVRLRNITFTPTLFRLFGASVTLPDFSAALTLEDGQGTVSN
jgi:Flp pilus assembly pilin Flp